MSTISLARCARRSLLVSSTCHRCEFASACDSFATCARSVGREQACPKCFAWHTMAAESGRPRPDDSRTGGFALTLATEKSFGQNQEDDVSLMPRKIAGSNNGDTQALAFADEHFWLARLAWSVSSGRHAHQRFWRHLRRLDKKRASSVTIVECSNWRGGTRNYGTVFFFLTLSL